MQCSKCAEFLPPGFVTEVEGTKDSLCIFCRRDVTTLSHKGIDVTKSQIVEEYKVAMKMIREKNEIIKKAARGIEPTELPSSVL